MNLLTLPRFGLPREPLGYLLRRQPLVPQSSASSMPPRCFAASSSAADWFRYQSREEERLIRTTLHELGSQREDMKLSMKVFHFQELSKSTLRDHALQRDGRYVRLKSDLCEDVKELSPTQLVATMVSAGRLKVRKKDFWWIFARGVERHVWKTKSGAVGLQFSEICLILHTLGRANIKLKTRFYYRMLRPMLNYATLWNEFDMAWILYAMRKRRLKPINENSTFDQLWAKVLKNIALNFQNKLQSISPQGIVFIMYEFARHEVYPGPVVHLAINRVRKYLPSLSDRALVALSSTLAKFDWPHRKLLTKISTQVIEPKRFVRMHPNMLVVILHAYALLSMRDVPVMKAMCGLFARSCANLDPRSRATLAYSLGKLGVRGPVWTTLGASIAERIDSHPPLQLALIAHAFGKVAACDQRLLGEALPDAALLMLPVFTAKHLCCILDGLTLAGFVHEDLFRSVFDQYVKLGSLGTKARLHMMSRVVFNAVVEERSFLKNPPPAWEALMRRAKPIIQTPREQQPYYEELGLLAKALSLEAQVGKRKGPHTADLLVPVPGGRHLALFLVAESEICPLTGELLGPTRLKQLELQRLKWTFLGLSRKAWLALNSSEARLLALEALFSRYVRTRKLPSAPLSALPAAESFLSLPVAEPMDQFGHNTLAAISS